MQFSEQELKSDATDAILKFRIMVYKSQLNEIKSSYVPLYELQSTCVSM